MDSSGEHASEVELIVDYDMSETKQRNPNWSRGETILAMDLYFKLDRNIPSISDERVIFLSSILRGNPVYPNEVKNTSFRNPASVVFKISNIHNAAGGTGLEHNSKLDKELWAKFGDDPEGVQRLAEAIRNEFKVLSSEYVALWEEEQVFIKGELLTRLHRVRERDPKLRKRVLANRRSKGDLHCDCCAAKPYGPLGDEGLAMLEVHHLQLQPLNQLGRRATRLNEVAVLCANCHRLMHALISTRGEWFDVQALRREIQSTDHSCVKASPLHD